MHKYFLVILATVLLSGCLDRSLGLGLGDEFVCNPLSQSHCGLPFPSDHFSVANPQSSTGKSLKYSSGLFNIDILNALPGHYSLESVFNHRTGFSPATPVYFELSAEIRPTTLPFDGGESLVIFDLDSGQRVPISARMSSLVASFGDGNLIEAFPKTRYEFGHRYIAVVTTELQSRSGEDFVRPAGVIEATDPTNSSGLAATYKNEIEFLRDNGIIGDEILTFTVFTISDEASITQPLMDVAASTANTSVEIDQVVAVPLPAPFSGLVTGRIKLNTVNPKRCAVKLDLSCVEGHEWTRFQLYLPTRNASASVPVMIHAHGIGADRGTSLLVAVPNARKGVATVTFDQLHHGSRILDGSLADVTSAGNLDKLVNIMNQTSVDLHMLLQAVQCCLANRDFNQDLPFGLNANYPFAEISPDNIWFGGMSLGGMFAPSFLSTVQQNAVKGAFIQLSAVGATNILTHSGLWHDRVNTAFVKTRPLRNIIPESATPADAALIVALVQHSLDYTDGVNFTQYLVESSSRIMFAYATEDEVIPYESSQTLSDLLSLPHVSPGTDNLLEHFGQGHTSLAIEYGVFSNPLMQLLDLEIKGHESFLNPIHISDYEMWLEHVVVD